MLPAAVTSKAIQLCATILGAAQPPLVTAFPVTVAGGAASVRAPRNRAGAQATVRDLIALGADATDGPTGFDGRDGATDEATSSTAPNPRGSLRIGDDPRSTSIAAPATVSSVSALLRRSFGARITDVTRPANATYGAPSSWHKVGQAIDFVPEGGVAAIDREQIRALMAQNGIRLMELLGPGDRGHSDHWHIAFARPDQILERIQPVNEAENWIVNVAGAGTMEGRQPAVADAAPASGVGVVAKPPPLWDVFALAEWRSSKGDER